MTFLVLRMLSFHVGVPSFLKGVSLYLKAHLYANTVTSDLWRGIGQATGVDVEGIMKNWITEVRVRVFENLLRTVHKSRDVGER